MTENVHVCFEVHIEKNLKTLTMNKNGSFVVYVLDTVGRNFAKKVHTITQKVLIGKASLRFYAKSKFYVHFEVHIPLL